MSEIKRLLVDGALQEGDRLPPERDLATQLGVGRSSVREAIQALQLMGLVEVKHGIGMFLTSEPGRWLLEPLKWSTKGSANLFDDLIEARLPVEVTLARLSSERAKPNELLAIRRAVEECAKAEDGVAAGYRVHLSIAEAAHSEVLLFMVRATSSLFREILEPLRAAILETEDGEQKLRDFRAAQQAGHEAIAAAIESHDSEAAAEAMRMHLLELNDFYGDIDAAANLTLAEASPALGPD